MAVDVLTTADGRTKTAKSRKYAQVWRDAREAGTPIVVGSATFMMQPDYLGLLFTTGMGRALVITALLLQLIGVVWIRKIINIEV